ncbi:MAG: leucine-rich repeat domain-containing protein, partial [Acidobacteria bacterium]
MANIFAGTLVFLPCGGIIEDGGGMMSAKSAARLLIPGFVCLFLSVFLPASTQAGIPAEERQALIALYDSTGGPDWFKRTNWLGPEGTEGTWLGVAVESGHVVRVSLPGNGLKGVVPSEIAGLQQLEVLDLTGDQPFFDVPIGIRNQITSLAPAIGSLKKLRVLKMSGVGLQSLPDEICQLTGLATLELSYNQLTTLPSEIGALSNLRTLDVGSNLLASLPAGIGRLLALEFLTLWGNKLEHLPPEIGNLSSLIELHLGINPLVDIPPELGQLPNLVSISFGHVRRLPAGIGALKNVQKLSVRYLDSEELSAEV